MRAIGKASDSAALRQEGQDAQRHGPKARGKLLVEPVSRGGTKRHDPFWDGPRLSPAFVTQLLGQVMEPERNCLVRMAYGSPAERSARLLDTRF